MVIPRGRIELTYGADLIRRITRDTDIPVALEDDLDVFDVKRVRATKLRHFAGSSRDVVDEFVDKLEDGLVEGVDVSCDEAGIELRGKPLDGQGGGGELRLAAMERGILYGQEGDELRLAAMEERGILDGQEGYWMDKHAMGMKQLRRKMDSDRP